MVSPFTENALYSLWQLIAYKYVCAASQLFFFQQLVMQRSWIQRLFDSRSSYRKENCAHRIFCEMFNISKKTRRTDGHRMTEYTACIKIAILRTPAFIFCLPLGRPCGNYEKRCMNEKTIQCLPNPSQHVPIYLKKFPSYTMRQCVSPKIAIFTYRSPHFCFPWRRPCDYHAICCMDGKTIQCLPNPSELYDA